MEVIIVSGAPASGKTTYVKNNMQVGDFVVDLDAIRYAVSFAEQRTPVNNLTPSIMAIRDFIYSMIEQNTITAPRCWVIAGLPHKAARDKLSARLGARVVFMNTTEIECIQRAMQDTTRDDKEFQIKIITDYFTALYNDRQTPLKESRDKTISRFYAAIYRDIDD